MTHRQSRHLVLLAHGSRDPRHARDVLSLARRVGARQGVSVHASFLELCAPAPDELSLPDEGTVTLVPLFLAHGYHARTDVPAAAARLRRHGRTVHLTPAPLMQPHGWADRLLLDVRRRHEGPATSARTTLVVTAGTSDGDALTRWDAAASTWSRTVGPVRVAHVSGPGRRPEAEASAAHDDGAPVDVVVPALVADGYFADRVRACAASIGAQVTDVAGVSDAFCAAVAAQVA